MRRYPACTLVSLSMVLLSLTLASLAHAADPVRVFVLAGQSNMVGAGQVFANPDRNGGQGSLQWLTRDLSTASRFSHLIDENNAWVVREDVQIWFFSRKGSLAPGFGSNAETIGPELGFGWVVGEAYDEPVLLIKVAWGGKSIAQDFRPPSSGGDVGPFYHELIATTQTVLEQAPNLFPQFEGRTFELAGLGWHQGWNDRVNQQFNDEYEANLTNFIRDVRKDLDAPNLPFVIAETGMSGHAERHPRALSLMAAQAAVAQKEEFRGNVAFVGTRDFYRAPDVSPSGQQYHWNSNAETYYLIGDGMGRAMLHLNGKLPPDSQPKTRDNAATARHGSPVKVFILMGQSNMVGFGRVEPETTKGTLAYLTEVEGKYPSLQDEEGNWTLRDDVWCIKTTVGQKQDWLQPGFGARANFIGPEFQFGHVMGDMYDEPVLIIKASQGNRSLGWDILPPGSEQFTYDGRVYASYGDTPSSWVEGGPKEPVDWYAGRQYDDFVRDIHAVLDNLPQFFPSYEGQGYEVSGFAWWQGHKDQNAAHATRYELNLVNLIKSLRDEFEVPNAPFVLATIAFEGAELSGHGLTVANAQLAVSGDAGNYLEFAGNVKAVDARGFWRDREVSPNAQGYHYNHNAETYMDVGNALGLAMKELLKGQSAKPDAP